MYETSRERPVVALTLRLEGDERFVGIAAALATQVAHHIGRPEDEGRRLGDAVERAVTGVVEHAFHRDLHRQIEVEFLATETAVEICILYQGGAGALERGLSRHRNGGSALELMRRDVDRIEFGERDGREFCKITYELPDLLAS